VGERKEAGIGKPLLPTGLGCSGAPEDLGDQRKPHQGCDTTIFYCLHELTTSSPLVKGKGDSERFSHFPKVTLRGKMQKLNPGGSNAW
jgi:hypothetical protein